MTKPGLVDADAVHDGIGGREVNVLEYAGGEGRLDVAYFGVALVGVHVDEHGLARLDVADEVEAEGVDGDALAGHDVVEFCAWNCWTTLG